MGDPLASNWKCWMEPRREKPAAPVSAAAASTQCRSGRWATWGKAAICERLWRGETDGGGEVCRHVRKVWGKGEENFWGVGGIMGVTEGSSGVARKLLRNCSGEVRRRCEGAKEVRRNRCEGGAKVRR